MPKKFPYMYIVPRVQTAFGNGTHNGSNGDCRRDQWGDDFFDGIWRNANVMYWLEILQKMSEINISWLMGPPFLKLFFLRYRLIFLMSFNSDKTYAYKNIFISNKSKLHLIMK